MHGLRHRAKLTNRKTWLIRQERGHERNLTTFNKLVLNIILMSKPKITRDKCLMLLFSLDFSQVVSIFSFSDFLSERLRLKINAWSLVIFIWTTLAGVFCQRTSEFVLYLDHVVNYLVAALLLDMPPIAEEFILFTFLSFFFWHTGYI